jgi:purine-binding chemotaxis protein CheW
MSEDLQCVVFQLADTKFAIDIQVVNEIIVRPQVTAVPQAPPWAEGIANLRGRVLPVIDIRKRLGMSSALEATHALVLSVGGETLGILVEGVSEVLRIPADQVTPPPAELEASHDSIVQAVYHWRDDFVLIWDSGRLLGDAERPGLLTAATPH